MNDGPMHTDFSEPRMRWTGHTIAILALATTGFESAGGDSVRAAKALVSVLYLLAFVAVLLMGLGLLWLIVRRARILRRGLKSRPQVKYFDLRGETNIDDPEDPPHEPSCDERRDQR